MMTAHLVKPVREIQGHRDYYTEHIRLVKLVEELQTDSLANLMTEHSVAAYAEHDGVATGAVLGVAVKVLAVCSLLVYRFSNFEVLELEVRLEEGVPSLGVYWDQSQYH